MIILETGRLFLREFKEEDSGRMSELYSDEEVMKYIGRGGVISAEQTRNNLDYFRKFRSDNGFGIWAVINKENNLVCGHCGFNRITDDNKTSYIEIAYLLARDQWGKGLATEIAKATLAYGFEKLNLNKISALAYPENTPSINVIKKLGMKSEGEKNFFGKKFLFFSIER